ncbi:hypothetical protein KC349_g2992 [Hortaea werneckii]|nr:hypothetical protein KC349_g2992 [Hortaea werneckii]
MVFLLVDNPSNSSGNIRRMDSLEADAARDALPANSPPGHLYYFLTTTADAHALLYRSVGGHVDVAPSPPFIDYPKIIDDVTALSESATIHERMGALRWAGIAIRNFFATSHFFVPDHATVSGFLKALDDVNRDLIPQLTIYDPDARRWCRRPPEIYCQRLERAMLKAHHLLNHKCNISVEIQIFANGIYEKHFTAEPWIDLGVRGSRSLVRRVEGGLILDPAACKSDCDTDSSAGQDGEED